MLPSQVKSAAPKRRQRLRFLAVVRFNDGHRGAFSVDNASDHDAARRMVIAELDDVATVLITALG